MTSTNKNSASLTAWVDQVVVYRKGDEIKRMRVSSAQENGDDVMLTGYVLRKDGQPSKRGYRVRRGGTWTAAHDMVRDYTFASDVVGHE